MTYPPFPFKPLTLSLVIEFPSPPSINKLYGTNWQTRRRFLSKEGEQWFASAANAVKPQLPPKAPCVPGPVSVIHDLDDDTAAAIAGLEVEVRRVAGEADEELEGQPHGGALKRQHGSTARLHKIKLTDKKGALDSLARIRGLFVDRTEITGKDGGPVELSDAKAALLRGVVPNTPGKRADPTDQ